MNLVLNRLDPNVPDPVESRRRAAGRTVRFAYAATVFGVIGFFVIYFGAPAVFLSGPGTVTSVRHVISMPYAVQVVSIDVAPGAEVKKGQEIGLVRSPEQDGIESTYMRALSDLAGRGAELRVKARVAQDTLEAARNYLKVTEQAASRIESAADARSVTMSYQVEIYREQALARKALASQEAEAAESKVQLAELDAFTGQLRARLDAVTRDFAGGKISAPLDGIVSTGLAHAGQSLVAGTTIAEILDPADVFVEWYIPNERLADPSIGQAVFVLFGNRRITSRITEILPVSGVYATALPVFARDRPATQLARIRFDAGEQLPPLNTTVTVHMYYTALAARLADWITSALGLR